ncbi:MAG: insulinase family protein, partial [Cyclobacteriaceae bacterium]
VEQVTKEDLIRVGNKYFGKNRMKFISRTGFPKKNKLKKPPYKPLITDQKETSDYAKKFEKIPSLPFEPKFIDFDEAIDREELKGGHTLLVTTNPINELFNLTIRFKKGRSHDERIPLFADFLRNAGAGNYDRNTLQKQFAVKGLEYNIWTDASHLMFNVSGKEESFGEGLALLNLLMSDPKLTEEGKKSYVNQLYGDRKVERNDPDYMRTVLFNYALYGDRSVYMTRKRVADVKQTDLSSIVDEVKKITENYSTDIYYYGSQQSEEVADHINKTLSLTEQPKAEDYVYPPTTEVSGNKIYVVNDKKAVQSHMYFYVQGEEYDREDFAVMNAFNQYFGGGFTGLMLQEIREYRSLAYATGANYNEPLIPGKKGRLYTYIACQADKTNDAINVMLDLLRDMPQYEDRIEALRKNMQLKVVTEYPAPNDMVYEIVAKERKGYEQDPNRKAFDQYGELTMQQLVDFYEKNIKGRPITITVYGDQRSFSLEELRKIGEVIQLEKTDIAKF